MSEQQRKVEMKSSYYYRAIKHFWYDIIKAHAFNKILILFWNISKISNMLCLFRPAVASGFDCTMYILPNFDGYPSLQLLFIRLTIMQNNK